MRARKRARWTYLVALTALASGTFACGALLGAKDLYFDADASEGADGSGTGNDGTATGDAPQNGNDGQTAGDGSPGGDGSATDSGPCTADTTSDPANCGRCGHDCLGGRCMVSKCQPVPVATAQGLPTSVAVDNTSIYWNDYTGNSIVRANKFDGGGGLITGGLTSPFRVALDDTYIYWVHDAFQGPIMRCPLAGCSGGPTTIATAQFTVTDIATSPGFVVWYDVDQEEITSKALDGGTTRSVATGTGSNNNQRYENRLMTYNGVLYWSETTNGKILSAPLAGGATVPIASDLTEVNALATDGKNLYYTLIDHGGTVGMVPLPGQPNAGVTTPMASSQTFPISIATDGAYVYWLDEGDALPDGGNVPNGMLVRCPVGGCGTSPEALVSTLLDPRSLALDATAIYYVTAGDGIVWKLAKP